MDQVLPVVVKTVLGGVLVVTFAVLAQTLQPKRFAGVFAAAPSVALASLTVTVLAKGPSDARADCAGMIAGAAGFVVYCLVAPASMRRWRPLPGSIVALVGWLAATAAVLPAAAATPAAKAAAGAGLARLERRNPDRPPLRMRAAALREGRPRDWLIRFGFGAGTSLLAAVIGVVAGPVVGGTLLAFPAILLASLTMVAKEDGAARSRDDARGATFGALGLVAFAVLGAVCFGGVATPLVFAVCAAGWAVAGVGSFLLAWRLGAGADEPA
ncbi:MAG TPA: DUF3147 family protein [Amnibacterium sp.]|nr:DUF3147 family protein [Amnibacterium sp.]